MKAARFSSFGKPWDVIELVDQPEPGPAGDGEVTIDVVAAPINPADLLNIEGKYGAELPKLPVWAGGEGVGRITEVGAGVSHLKVGDLVLLLFAGRGNWRERLKAKAARLFPLPSKGVDAAQLAMLTVNPATAYLMLKNFVSLKAGDFVIQNAANSGVGHSVIKLAKSMGAKTINVVRRASLEAQLKAEGADLVLVDGADLETRVLTATGGQRPKLAIDAIGGEGTRTLGNCVADEGVIVNYGLLSGNACRVDARDTVFRDVSLRGFWLAKWFQIAPPAEQQETYAKLTRMVAEGVIHVPVEASYGLDRIKDALAHAAREGRNGKVLITPNR